jgi:hypothetical protein
MRLPNLAEGFNRILSKAKTLPAAGLDPIGRNVDPALFQVDVTSTDFEQGASTKSSPPTDQQERAPPLPRRNALDGLSV